MIKKEYDIQTAEETIQKTIKAGQHQQSISRSYTGQLTLYLTYLQAYASLLSLEGSLDSEQGVCWQPVTSLRVQERSA